MSVLQHLHHPHYIFAELSGQPIQHVRFLYHLIHIYGVDLVCVPEGFAFQFCHFLETLPHLLKHPVHQLSLIGLLAGALVKSNRTDPDIPNEVADLKVQRRVLHVPAIVFELILEALPFQAFSLSEWGGTRTT